MTGIEPMRVLSLGGGTQSCALALMSAAGDLPRLDHVVFADTQGELPETYAYLDYLRSVLDGAGIPLHVVTAGNLYDDLIHRDGPSDKNPTPPMHVLNPDGTKGRISHYRCSYDYKRRIVERKVKQLCGKRGQWKQSNVEQWIGFSLDEQHRCKQADGCRCGHKRISRIKGEFVQIHNADGCTRCPCAKFDPWQTNAWPLIDSRMVREDTIRWFRANGHPTPPRSACWFCPNSGNARWQALRTSHPDLFDAAVRLDAAVRGGGGFNARGNQPFAGKLFLHGSLVPLGEADLRTDAQVRADNGELQLFDADALAADCEAGVCFT